MILRGLDEDWSKVDPTQAYRDGFRFIFGYVSQDITGKNLSASDILRIRQAGLAIGLVYEYNPQSALGGYQQGVIDAQIAIAHADSIGAPSGVALYAAVDWNVTTAQMSTVLAYATGFLVTCVAAGFRSGIYGGYPVCLYLSQHNYGGFLWQTYAWSGVPPVWLAAAVVRQTANGVFEAGATIDIDESEAVDFGQWEAEMSDVVLLSIEMQDNTVRSGPTDGLGNFHWIPDGAALAEYQAATGLQIRVVTQDMAYRAYGINFNTITPPPVTIGAVSVSGALTLTPKV